MRFISFNILTKDSTDEKSLFPVFFGSDLFLRFKIRCHGKEFKDFRPIILNLQSAKKVGFKILMFRLVYLK